ncbi:glycoside hydrolase family 44 protein [Fimbriimonas ginsengisoli]|uniref:Glycoside hydrolase n=1 Tax=Fimbriimonas ginsengisoli Gsoil 348 TaxID=661478 RepID=A0A068NKY3_FIMGI|nr:glycoside hydrolase family 44 protein [Fimbriimonas ginsengisoli]AIE84062.1 glycoside hydrolase [Fimbriimonas ginsengisoli Gsoil 348]
MIFSLLVLSASAAPTIVIDASDVRPISPFIYGINNPDWKGIGRGVTLARQGGNRMTAYNWETNASNAGNDYHHQNDNYLGASNEPGWTVSNFLRPAQSHGAAAILTVPTAGYVAADKNGDGDVAKTPNYLSVRFLKSYAHKPGRLTYPPNTKDRAVYQDEFVAWVEKIKSNRTPVWFSLDNEPDLWGSTHQRIWPKNPTYAQIIANNVEFAMAIKRVAPKALVFGPANYGWQGFRRFQDAADANGRDFLNTYLDALHQAERKGRRRLLDVLDVHWYPEARGDNVRITDNNDKPGTAAARIQAPRSLWDPTYVETSWIADSLGKKPIELLPRIQTQIAQHYPGTKFAITEYNYGGGNHISGAVAQADVLGIFGRYGLFAACNWGLNPRDQMMLAGFDAFADFDRHGSRFGDLGLKVTGTNAEANSVYAALDSKNRRRMTIVAINKTGVPMPLTLSLRGFRARNVRAFAVTSDAYRTPRAASARVKTSVVTLTAAPFSVTTLELSK